jgi:hypothetical protein
MSRSFYFHDLSGVHSRTTRCIMKDMSCSVIEEIEKQVKNWRPFDTRVKLEQLVLLKEVHIGRRS